MEIPDKEDQPYEYVSMRLKELKGARWISEEERKPAYALAHDIFCVGREVESSYIEEAHKHLIDTLDIVLGLILEGKAKNNSSLIYEIIEDSGKILERVDEISCLLEEVINKTKSLEAKAVSEDIINDIGKIK
jgi:hypothetical protein